MYCRVIEVSELYEKKTYPAEFMNTITVLLKVPA